MEKNEEQTRRNEKLEKIVNQVWTVLTTSDLTVGEIQMVLQVTAQNLGSIKVNASTQEKE